MNRLSFFTKSSQVLSDSISGFNRSHHTKGRMIIHTVTKKCSWCLLELGLPAGEGNHDICQRHKEQFRKAGFRNLESSHRFESFKSCPKCSQLMPSHLSICEHCLLNIQKQKRDPIWKRADDTLGVGLVVIILGIMAFLCMFL